MPSSLTVEGFEVGELLAVEPGRHVYRARRTDQDAKAPLEMVVLLESLEDSLTSRSLLAELERRLGLRAPSLQRVFAAGRLDEDRIYAIVEPPRGSAMPEHTQAGPLPLGRSLHLAIQLAGFVSDVWEAGLTTGPITPERVHLLPQWAGTDEVQVLTTWFVGPHGRAMETSGFTAPEWSLFKDDQATDLFSLGAVIIQAMTGAPPYSPDQRARAVREGEPPPWSHLVDAEGEPIPPALNRMLRDLVSYDSGARPLDIGAVRARLTHILENEVAPRIGPPTLFEHITDVPSDIQRSGLVVSADGAIRPRDTALTPQPDLQMTEPDEEEDTATTAVRATSPPRAQSEPPMHEEDDQPSGSPMVWVGVGVGALLLLVVGIGAYVAWTGFGAGVEPGAGLPANVEEPAGDPPPAQTEPPPAAQTAQPVQDTDVEGDTEVMPQGSADASPAETAPTPPPRSRRRRTVSRPTASGTSEATSTQPAAASGSAEPADGEAQTPEATEPEATEPEATEPEATEPEATEPESKTPSSTGSDLRNPFGN